ncbi:MAG: hypothetical protein Fur0010_21150 [Bdellovibrio sp.]
MSVFTFIAIYTGESHLYREDMENFSDKFSKELLRNFESYLHPLQGLKSFYYAEKFEVTSSNHRRFSEARDLYSNFPGALGFGFIRKVESSQTEKYLKQMQAERKDFTLRRLSDERTSRIDELFVIEVVEPVEKNRSAVGLVVSDELHLREAALFSMKTGLPALTKSIQLVQSNKVEPGFLLYLPMYAHSNTPLSERERIEKNVGWVYTPILASSVIRDSLSRTGDDFRIQIKEVDNQESKLIFDGRKDEKSGAFNQILEHDFYFGGQHWHISIDEWPMQKSYLNRFMKHNTSISILFLGLLLTMMIYYYFKSEEFEDRNNEINKFRELHRERGEYLNKILDKIPEAVSYWSSMDAWIL